jgi:hypothetical protein
MAMPSRTGEASSAKPCTKCGAPEQYVVVEGVTHFDAHVKLGIASITLQIRVPRNPLCESCFVAFVKFATARQANKVTVRLSYMNSGAIKCSRCSTTCASGEWLEVKVFGGAARRLCRSCLRSQVRTELVNQAVNAPQSKDNQVRAKLVAAAMKNAEEYADQAFAKVFGKRQQRTAVAQDPAYGQLVDWLKSAVTEQEFLLSSSS